MSEPPEDTRYRDLDPLGQGGFGAVTRAFDRVLRREVARKRARHPGPRERERLLHEARLLAWLDHPGVVQVHDVASDPGAEAVTMALVDGEILAAHLAERRARGRPVPVSEALRILRRLSETMANAHDKGVLHLDLKPANVVLQPYGRVVIVDWGAARFFDRGPYAAHLARAGEDASFLLPPRHEVVGTMAYMAPEQAVGEAGELGPWSDVFAAGVVLYELLAGALPFESGGAPLAQAYRRTRPPPPLAERRADVSPALSRLCAGMLAARPERRLASFHAVLAELDALATPGVGPPGRELAPGEVLFREGEPGDVAWQILAGRLEVRAGPEAAPRVLGTRGVGEVVGEVSLLTGRPRSATLRAVEASVVRPVRPEDIESELAKVSPLVAGMVRHLSLRLRESVDQAGAGLSGGSEAAVHAALAELRRDDPAQAELAEAVLVGGLGLDGAAALVGMAPERARREWAMARALLRRRLRAASRAGADD